MAKGLGSLVRLAEWGVEQKRRALGDILGLLESYENKQKKLEQEIIDEQQAAADSPGEAGFLYGIYASNVIIRRKHLANLVQQTEIELEQARIELSDAYRDLKKYEIARDVREKREQKERDKKDQDMLDDLGLQLAQRKKVNES